MSKSNLLQFNGWKLFCSLTFMIQCFFTDLKTSIKCIFTFLFGNRQIDFTLQRTDSKKKKKQAAET